MRDVSKGPRKKGKAGAKRAVLFLLGLALPIAVGGFGCKKSSPATNSPGKDAHASPVKGILHLEPFVVNLADPEENRFLRLGIDLGLENPISAKEGKDGEGEVPVARIRDCILTVVSTWRSDALLAPDGKQKLKDELLRGLRGRAPEMGVKEIYFTDFLVQR